MFKKIISNLSFSPSLIGELSIYAKNIKKEESIRRLGLFFIVLSLLVQFLIIFKPAESANSSNSNDLSPATKTCEFNPSLKSNDKDCKPQIVKYQKSINTTQGFVDASSTIAKAGDQISYNITAENKGAKSEELVVQDNLRDILEYSTLIDNGGGSLDTNTNILSWPKINMASNSKQTKTFTVRVLNTIPATAQSQVERGSFDCKIVNIYGNQTSIKVDCPDIKLVEKITSKLPKTGLADNIMYSLIVVFIATYFYARSSQLKKEVAIARDSAHAGLI